MHSAVVAVGCFDCFLHISSNSCRISSSKSSHISPGKTYSNSLSPGGHSLDDTSDTEVWNNAGILQEPPEESSTKSQQVDEVLRDAPDCGLTKILFAGINCKGVLSPRSGRVRLHILLAGVGLLIQKLSQFSIFKTEKMRPSEHVCKQGLSKTRETRSTILEQLDFLLQVIDLM